MANPTKQLVTRYNLISSMGFDEPSDEMREAEDGNWVEYAEYASLLQAVTDLENQPSQLGTHVATCEHGAPLSKLCKACVKYLQSPEGKAELVAFGLTHPTSNQRPLLDRLRNGVYTVQDGHDAAREIERLRAAAIAACSAMGCFCIMDRESIPPELRCEMCKLNALLSVDSPAPSVCPECTEDYGTHLTTCSRHSPAQEAPRPEEYLEWKMTSPTFERPWVLNLYGPEGFRFVVLTAKQPVEVRGTHETSCPHPAMKGVKAWKCEVCGELSENNTRETPATGGYVAAVTHVVGEQPSEQTVSKLCKCGRQLVPYAGCPACDVPALNGSDSGP